MENNDEQKANDQQTNSKESDTKKGKDKPYERWKDKDKNQMGNDVSSEIKIANAEGRLEGGDNKQWHMDQGDFDEQEKKDFENNESKDA